MKRKVHWLSLAVAGAVLTALPDSLLQAQQPQQPVETRATRGRGTAPDENITKARAPNTPGQTEPAPAAKGGEAARGSSCTVKVDNYTGLYIDVYLDRVYRGTVGPWGELWRTVGCGETRLYGRADYTDGTYDTWGPVYAQVGSLYTWRLRP